MNVAETARLNVRRPTPNWQGTSSEAAGMPEHRRASGAFVELSLVAGAVRTSDFYLAVRSSIAEGTPPAVDEGEAV